MIDRAVRTRDAWTESLICSSVGGEKSRDRARKGKGFAILDRLTTLFLRGEMKEGQRAARCQRKYAPRVFQNTLANVPRPIDQEITGNDIRTSLCSRAVRSCAETRLPVSLLSGHLIFLWRGEKYFGQTIPIECLLFPFFLFSSKRKKFLHRQSWKMCKFNFLWTWNISLFLFSFLKIARREHVLCSTKRAWQRGWKKWILFYFICNFDSITIYHRLNRTACTLDETKNMTRRREISGGRIILPPFLSIIAIGGRSRGPCEAIAETSTAISL